MPSSSAIILLAALVLATATAEAEAARGIWSTLRLQTAHRKLLGAPLAPPKIPVKIKKPPPFKKFKVSIDSDTDTASFALGESPVTDSVADTAFEVDQTKGVGKVTLDVGSLASTKGPVSLVAVGARGSAESTTTINSYYGKPRTHNARTSGEATLSAVGKNKPVSGIARVIGSVQTDPKGAQATSGSFAGPRPNFSILEHLG